MGTKPPTAPREGSRQHMIENLAINESISISSRLAMDYGIGKDVISHHASNLRNSIDGQVVRARRRFTERTWTVEIGQFITHGNALMICCVVTRLN